MKHLIINIMKACVDYFVNVMSSYNRSRVNTLA